MPDLSQAISLHRAGRLAEAQAIYRQILAAAPDHAEANHLLGLVACQSGQLESAVDLITRALRQQPDNAEYLINLGEVQRRLGRFAEAIASCRHATALVPGNPVAHYNLAVALAAGGQSTEAIAAYRQALTLKPAFPEALNNLGLLLRLAGQNAEAVTCLRQALALRPAHAEAENNLGLALWNVGEYAPALEAFTEATLHKPDFAVAHANRGWALRRTGQRLEAVGAFQKAARLHPDSADIQRDLAMALLDIRLEDAAIAAARRAVELAPRQADTHHALGIALGVAAKADPSLRPQAVACYHHALALQPQAEWEFELAILEDRTPNASPDEYVRRLFDDYAPRFDDHLVGQLHYRVPEELLAAVTAAWTRLALPAKDLDILDLGSGTGLCGKLFRPHARTLTGIDLSEKMIATAQRRRDSAGRPLYDRLIHSHILPALQPFENAFDLVVAGDVLIYIGALEEMLAAIARVLRRGGLLAFSLESHDGADGQDFILRERFRHDIAYIRRLAAATGLTEITAQTCLLRSDVPPGWLVILQK